MKPERNNIKNEGTVDFIKNEIPGFYEVKNLSTEQLIDPDFRLKSLKKLYGNKYPVSCSRCHHCR
jgi:hypothetical protein